MYWRIERFRDRLTYGKVFPTRQGIDLYKQVRYAPETVSAAFTIRATRYRQSRGSSTGNYTLTVTCN